MSGIHKLSPNLSIVGLVVDGPSGGLSWGWLVLGLRSRCGLVLGSRLVVSRSWLVWGRCRFVWGRSGLIILGFSRVGNISNIATISIN